MSSQRWEVVGGEVTGGILVREGESLHSPKLDRRLATGARVEELAIEGERLHYRLLEGLGPETGWVSLRVKDGDLLVQVSGEDDGPPPREAGAEALANVVMRVDSKQQGAWQLKVPGDCLTVGDWKATIQRKELVDDDILAKFANKLVVKSMRGGVQEGPTLSDSAWLPVDPESFFVTGPGAVPTTLALALQNKFGAAEVPEPRRLRVSSSCPGVQGGYEETSGGSQVFGKQGEQGSSHMTLFRDRDPHAGGQASRWFFGEDSSAFTSFLVKSEEDALKPEDARWPEDVGGIAAYSEAAEAREDDALFKDDDFPHTRESVGADLQQQLPCQPEWLAARRLWSGAGPMKLFDGIQPNDLLQGQIGDCWLIAAMAGLAEFPSEVKGLFVDRGQDVQGRYAVHLFDHLQGEWRDVVVDEFVPCLPKQWSDAKGTPLFARPNGNEMWCILLEKAMAKIFGCYSKLIANNCGVAFRAFTGAQENLMWMKRDLMGNGSAWFKYKLMQRGCDFDPCMQDTDFRMEHDAFFETLSGYDNDNYLMSASLEVSHSSEYRRPDGLVEGHAYSLLKVTTVEGTRLLLMRNPWGNNCEWNGRWSDSSEAWEQNPKVKEELRPTFADDGLFWMEWSDFVTTWDMVNVCMKAMRTGAAMAAHVHATNFVGYLAGQQAKPRLKARKPTLVLKASLAGEDPTEAAGAAGVEVSAETLVRALLRRVFQRLDTSGDGRLQLKEATQGLLAVFGAQSEQVQRGQAAFNAIDASDANQQGFITEEEFVSAGSDFHKGSQDSAVTAALKSFNATHSLWAAIRCMKITDSTGAIGKEEIAELLKSAAVGGCDEAVCLRAAEQLVKDFDGDGDGAVSLEEWMAMMGAMTSLCESTNAEPAPEQPSRNVKLLQDLGVATTRLRSLKETKGPSRALSCVGSPTHQAEAGGALERAQDLVQVVLGWCQGCWAGLRA